MGTDDENQTPEMYICTGPGQYEKLDTTDFSDGYVTESPAGVNELEFPYILRPTTEYFDAESQAFLRKLHVKGKKRFRKLAMQFRDVDRDEIETWQNIVRYTTWSYTDIYILMLICRWKR